MKKLILLLSFGLLTVSQAQTTNAPRTYFDAFYATPDVVLVKGMSIIGTLSAQINYPVEVRAEQLTSLQTSNTVYAVSVRTRVSKQPQIDYIDYDELDGLIRGIHQMSQADASITTMDNFEVVYRTRSGLSLAKINVGAKMVIAMKSGDVNGQRNQMAAFVLDDFGRLLVSAKAKIDAVAQNGP